MICRKISAREVNAFAAPLSSRYDELDGQMWLDDVFIPWERVFLLDQSPEPIARWLFWHQLYCWLSKAEFTLGLALACTHAIGLTANEPTIEYLIDLIVDVQTVRSCQIAAELDPEFTSEGYCYPNHRHVAAGSIAMLNARPRMSEILRILPGSSLVVAPSDRDLAAPEVAAGLDECSAAVATPQSNAPPCCRWPGTTCPRRSMAVNRRSNCTRMAACPPGAAVCGAISTATTSWRTPCYVS